MKMSEFPEKHSLSWNADALFARYSPRMGRVRTREMRQGKMEAILDDSLLCGPQLQGKA